MEREPGSRPPRSILSDHAGCLSGTKVASRSRSPSPNPLPSSRQRFRERSPPGFRESAPHRPNDRHDELEGDGGPLHHHHHHHQGGDCSRRRRQSRQDEASADDRREERQPRHRRGEQYQHHRSAREGLPRSAETDRARRQVQDHDCMDSTLRQEGGPSLSPAPTPPRGPADVSRPPAERYRRQYSSHRCHHQSHTRSPSPHAQQQQQEQRHHNHHHHHHRSRRRARRRSSTNSAVSAVVTADDGFVSLPYGARALSRWDFAAFEPLFAYYLEVHKMLNLAELDEREVRGRWKSFVGRWNRGELAEGWYEPEMFIHIVRTRTLEEVGAGGGLQDEDEAMGGGLDGRPAGRLASVVGGGDGEKVGLSRRQVITPPMTGTSVIGSLAGSASGGDGDGDSGDGNDDDDWGPTLPSDPRYRLLAAGEAKADASALSTATTTTSAAAAAATIPRNPGASVPSLQDLEQREAAEAEEREERAAELRRARRAERRQQAERLDELVPRAEAGTRERQLEKRKAVADKMREIGRETAAARAGEMEEVGEGELMGGGDGAEDYRRVLATMQRRKTERELRREEMARARNAERDERIREYRERERERVEMLQELAKQRFG